jgi:outer membrane protein assembly factor BamE (lipoprotein component of BamABCDE complex)
VRYSLRHSRFIGLLAFVLAGCPVPIPPLGYIGVHGNIPDRPSDLIVKGKTTRADVLLLLGSPDSLSPDGRRFEYHSELHQGGVLFVIAAAGQAGGLGPEAFRERRLIVGFDANGVVDAVEFEDKSCTRVAGFGGNTGGRSGPCLPVSEGGAIALQQGPPEGYYVPRTTDASFEDAWWSPACRARGPMEGYLGKVILTEDALILSGTGRKLLAQSSVVTIRIPLADIGELVRATDSEHLPEPLWIVVRGGGCVEVNVGKSTYLGLGPPDRTQSERLIRLLESRLGMVARPP